MVTAPVPAETPAVGVPLVEPLMSFDDAFKDFVKDEPTSSAPALAAAAAASTPPTGDTPATEIVEPGAENLDPEAARVPDEDTTVAEQKNATEEALSRLADMMAQRQQPQQPAYQPPQQQPQSPYTAEQQSIVAKFYEDFPDVAQAASIERAAEYRALTQHIFTQVGAYFAPRLALLEQLADRTVYSDLTTRVSDYDTTRDKVVEWVKFQPAYLQGAYNSVIQQGTVDEISDLFDRYRAATGAAPAPAGGIAPAQGNRQVAPAAPKAPELSPAARQAAERLAPIASKRSAPTNQSPVDFDSAFEQFAKAI